MKRLLVDKLIKWKESPRRNPLILKGMRQVGKTWILKEFGRQAYEDISYFNFENNESLTERFQKNLDPQRLIMELGIINGAAKSLGVYRSKFNPSISGKTSMRNLGYVDGVLSCSLYLLWKLDEFMKTI